MGFIAIFFESLSKNMYVSVPNRCKTLNKSLLALWILKLLILQRLCSIRYWFGSVVNSEQRNSLYLMIGICTDCRGCIIDIIPNFWFFCLERVAWFHFCSSSGTCASSWRSSNFFTLSCLGMIIFIRYLPWSSISLSTFTSCHSGNTLLCKETIECRSTTSGLLLIPHYYATTLSLRRTLGDKIDNKI